MMKIICHKFLKKVLNKLFKNQWFCNKFSNNFTIMNNFIIEHIYIQAKNYFLTLNTMEAKVSKHIACKH